MSDARIIESLRRIFDAILREAERNPALSQRLALIMAETFDATLATKPRRSKRSDVPQIHAVNILRQHGEAALRGTLEQIKAVETLKLIASSSGLVLAGDACKARASRESIINAIIASAKHYDAQRTAAAM